MARSEEWEGPGATIVHATRARLATRSPLRPFVTLTFASTLDGSIAAADGRALPISGREALCVTHALRANHDAILVGVGTVVADDPSLTTRLVSGPNPQPLVLDPNLRTPTDCKLLTHPSTRRPILLTSGADPLHPPHPDVHAELLAHEDSDDAWRATWGEARRARATALESAGARLLLVPSAASDPGAARLPWSSVLRALARGTSIASVMVEGGQRVIEGLLRDEGDDGASVDWVVLTLAPWFLGGTPFLSRPPPARSAVADDGERGARRSGGADGGAHGVELVDRVVETVGSDILLAGRLRRKE